MKREIVLEKNIFYHLSTLLLLTSLHCKVPIYLSNVQNGILHKSVTMSIVDTIRNIYEPKISCYRI